MSPARILPDPDSPRPTPPPLVDEERFAARRAVDAVVAIAAAGYRVTFVDYCESARTPGLLGQILGVTDREQREVRIAQKAIANNTLFGLADTLEHEARHVLEPSWDCGNRDVLGRGGPA